MDVMENGRIRGRAQPAGRISASELLREEGRKDGLRREGLAGAGSMLGPVCPIEEGRLCAIEAREPGPV